jgi:hypothetical protein
MRLFRGFTQFAQENPKFSFILGHEHLLSHFLNIHISLRILSLVVVQPELLITQLHDLNADKTGATNTAEPIRAMGNVIAQVDSYCMAAAGEEGQYGWHLAPQQRLCYDEVMGHIQKQGDEAQPLTQNASPSGHNRTHQKTSANRKLCYPIPLQVKGGR